MNSNRTVKGRDINGMDETDIYVHRIFYFIGAPQSEFLQGLSVVGVQQIDRVVEVVEETLKGEGILFHMYQKHLIF